MTSDNFRVECSIKIHSNIAYCKGANSGIYDIVGEKLDKIELVFYSRPCLVESLIIPYKLLSLLFTEKILLYDEICIA